MNDLIETVARRREERVRQERDDLRAACEMVPPLLRQIRGLASDVFGGESSLTDCIDLVLSETEAAIARAKEQS